MNNVKCIITPIIANANIRHVNLDSLTKELNPRLEEYIRNTGDEMGRMSNVRADMTRYQTVCPEFTELQTIITPYISDFFMNQKPPFKISPKFIETWGALYKKGDYTRAHCHEPSKLSWIYYVKVSEKSTPLYIHNVASGSKEETFKIPPTISDLVVFPSWVKHSVPKQLIEEERIVVAGNVDIVWSKK
tara:strand:- start:25 stop:591 length:567 start_codon:yes stop_codon:yes gene_type:complete